MASKDYFADGQWNFFCDLCGAKNKSSDGRKTWDNFYVCSHHKEERNPQDFLRGVKDDQSVPWSRPEPADNFVPRVWDRSFADSLPFEEVLVKATTKAAVESLGFTESLVLARLIRFTESLALSESLSQRHTIGVAETLPLGESLRFDETEFNAVSLPLTETLTRSLTKALSEAFTFTESLSFSVFSPTAVDGAAINTLSLN